MHRLLYVLFLLGVFTLAKAAEPPCLANWKYRCAIPVSDSNQYPINNYPILVQNINTLSLINSGKMKLDGSDIRFLDENNQLLDYWIDPETFYSTNTKIWVALKILPVEDVKIYLFYGNTDAYAMSNPKNTFEFFEDFNTPLSDHWDNSFANGAAIVNNGILTLSANGNTTFLKSKEKYPFPVAVEVKVKSATPSNPVVSHFFGQVNADNTGYAMAYQYEAGDKARFAKLSENGSEIKTDWLTNTASLSGGIAGAWRFLWKNGSLYGSKRYSGVDMKLSDNTYTPDENLHVMVGIAGGVGSLEIDYLFIRKNFSFDLITEPGAEVYLPNGANVNLNTNAPICANNTLQLFADSIPGATYLWTGPNSYVSNNHSPVIPNASADYNGKYTCIIDLPGSGCNLTQEIIIEVAPETNAGIISGKDSVCYSKSTSLKLNSYAGNVLRWETSVTGKSPWQTINNTTDSLVIGSVESDAYFRAVVKSGVCNIRNSDSLRVVLDAYSNAGNINGLLQVCTGTNSGELKLNSYIGNEIQWQYKNTNDVIWTNGSTNIKQPYSGLTQSHNYRVIVKNGHCPADTGQTDTLIVSALSLGGFFNGVVVCAGRDSGVLKLNSYTGRVLQWEMSENGTNPWITIDNQTDTLEYVGLQKSTFFRAKVQNGACPPLYSSIDTLVVDKPADAGWVSGADTVCETAYQLTLSLKNYNHHINNWLKSSDANSWQTIESKSDSLNVVNQKSAYYKAVVSSKHGVCANDTSLPVHVFVNDSTLGGEYESSFSNLCAGTNSGTFRLTNYRGSILRWERSDKGASPWYTIINTTDSLAFENVTESMYYRAIVKASACGVKASESTFINVTQPSNGGVLSGSQSVCQKANNGTLTLAGYNGAIIKWEQSNDNATWNTANEDVAQPYLLQYNQLEDTTYYRVIVQNGVCKKDTSTLAKIITNPAPVLVFDYDTVNEGSITPFYNKSTISSGYISNYDWDFDNGYSSTSQNPKHLFNKPGKYNVVLKGRSEKNCWDSIGVEVIVKALPKVDFSFGNVCHKDTVFFSNLSTITDGDIIYRWSFGDGIVSYDTNTFHVFDTSGVYPVKLIVESLLGTKDSIIKNVIIYPRAKPSFTFDNICAGNTAQFINTSTLSIGTMFHYWEFGNGFSSSSLHPEHKYNLASDYTVFLKVTTDKGCVDTTSKTIEVMHNPISRFGFTKMPLGENTSFYDSSIINGYSNIVTWEWQFGNGALSSQQHPDYKYAAPGTYLVKLKVSSDSGCVHESSQNVDVYSLPVASFNSLNVCYNKPMSFENNSNGSTGTLYYIWDFGDGNTSNEKHPEHLYTSAGSYKVRLIVVGAGNARDTLMKDVYVFPLPETDFIFSNVCDGNPVIYDNTSRIDTGSITSYTWDFGDGTNSIQKSPTKLYYNAGSYNVKLEALSDKGCRTTKTQFVVIQPLPVANFSAKSVCNGEPVTFRNQSIYQSGVLAYEWSFGDLNESIKENPEHTYAGAGIYSVKLRCITPFGCKDSIYRNVQVYQLPAIDAGADTSISKGFSVQLKGKGGLIYDWLPSEGLDNATKDNPIARPMQTTTYSLTVEDANGCINADSITIYVVENFKLFPNNVITPDGNGQNDFWVIDNIDAYESAELRILNRWGKLVYFSSAYDNTWDGRNSNGDILPDGTYYYIIRFNDSDKSYSGAVTVLRNRGGN